ncbi:MAG: right-handed parallel beta-helix repeat-containing protein [Desulfuromonadales bacterium]
METKQILTATGSIINQRLRIAQITLALFFVLFASSLLLSTSGFCSADRYFYQANVPTLSVPDSTIGSTYYIDGKIGNDSWNGRSPVYTSGINGPFKTIGYATGPYSGRLVGGNVFKIKAGTYRERLEFRNATGNTDENHRIVIGPYGDGEVILDASDTNTLTWSVYSGNSNIYVAHCDLMLGSSRTEPLAVIMNDNFKSCRPVYNLANANSFGKWYYDAVNKNLYVYTGGLTPESQKIIVSSSDPNTVYMAFDAMYTDYLTLYGLTISGASSYAVNSYGTSFRVENCTIKYSGKAAIKTYGPSPKMIKNHIYGNVMMNWPRGHTWNYSGGWPSATAFASGNNGYMSGNIIEYNGGEGFITGGFDSTGVVVEDNIVHDNWSVNLYIDGQGGAIFRRNLTYASNVSASDLVSPDDPTVPTWIPWAELQPKLMRRLYPICLNQAVELGEYAGQTILMSNNQIYDNIAIGCFAGVSTDCEMGTNGPVLSGFPNSVIANNTIIMPTDAPPTGATWTGIGWMYCAGTNTGSIIKNNIVTNTRTESFSLFLEGGTNEAGKTAINNNLYYNPNTANQFTAYNYPKNLAYNITNWKSSMTGQDSQSISSNPLFSGGADIYSPLYYMLQSGSPARGMGSNLTSFNTDFNSYTKAMPWTVGALEYGSVYVYNNPPPIVTSPPPTTGSVDSTAPVLASFIMPTLATALTVPVNAFSATDNVGVTGFFIGESPTAPVAGGAGWSPTVPATFTFAGEGARIAYAWAKDSAGNVSASRSAAVNITLSSGSGGVVDAGADYLAVISDNGAATLVTGNQLGQSFKLTKSGKIYSITAVLSTSGSGGDAVLRWGTSPDLRTSYISEVKALVTNSSYAPIEFVIQTQDLVTAGTLYYFALTSEPATFNGTLYVSRINDGTYPNGNALYGSNWNVSAVDGTRDMLFQVRTVAKSTISAPKNLTPTIIK